MSRDSFGDNFSGGAASRSQLNSFLGMPSDGGMHSLSSNTPKSYDGNNVQINRGMQTGANGGTGYGTSITGPQGNTAFRGVGESADGTVAAGRGVSGADGGGAAQGVARGADGGVAAFGGARDSYGNAAAARRQGLVQTVALLLVERREIHTVMRGQPAWPLAPMAGSRRAKLAAMRMVIRQPAAEPLALTVARLQVPPSADRTVELPHAARR